MRVFVVLFVCFNVSFAQTELSLYRLGNALPQSNMLNPAFTPNFKWVIGLPVISSARISADLDGIAFADVLKRYGSESFTFDTAAIASSIKEVNNIRLSQSLQLFYLGTNLGRNYVSLGLHQVSDVMISYPGDLVGWAIRGPGHSQYVGHPLDLRSLYAKGLAYNKMSISLGRSVGNRLRLGARFNYLLGLGMVESTKLNGELIVGIDSVMVKTGEVRVNTAGVDFFVGTHHAKDYLNYIVKTKNNGMSWDFGATYQFTKRLSASAAVNNVGFITWRDYTRSYRHDPVTYTYRGIDAFQYINRSGQVNVQQEIDSLRSLFHPTQNIGEKYVTRFIGKGYAGINYQLSRVNNFNALVAIDLLRANPHPLLSLGYTLQLASVLNANIGVTFRRGKFENIGAGLALRLYKVQLFATSESAQSMMHPARATRADLHGGLNLVFDDLHEDLIKNVYANNPGANKKVLKQRRHPETYAKSTNHPVNPPRAHQQNVNQPVWGLRDKRVHVVVVGTFTSRDSANTYSGELTQRNFTNKVGYDSRKPAYRVYVYQSRDRGEARHVRNVYRKGDESLFAKTWVLTISDRKFE